MWAPGALKILKQEKLRQLAAERAHQRGLEAQQSGDRTSAEAAYQEALALVPGRLRSLNNLAVLRMDERQLTDADRLLSEAMRRIGPGTPGDAPETALLLNSLCQLRLRQHRPAEAQLAARLLVQLDPGSKTWSNLAMALRAQGATAQALRTQAMALGAGIDQDPQALLWVETGSAEETAQRHRQLQNLAILQLALNPWDLRGWQLLEARLGCNPQHWQGKEPRPWQRLWRGESVKELVVWDEQGYGDAIQCLRWLPLAGEHCQRLTLLVRPGLQRLLEGWPSLQPLLRQNRMTIATLDSGGMAPWQQDRAHCPLMSLPVALDLQGVEAIAEQRNLASGGKRSQVSVEGRRRIGLVWTAGRKDDADARLHSERRSLPPDVLEQLLLERHGEAMQRGEIELVNLQLGEPLPQWRMMSSQLVPGAAPCDWADTARCVSQLEQVITVDTAMVHLAGSLGVPTLLVLNHPNDWRWGESGARTAWYPSVDVIRKSWQPPVRSA